jgi:AraC family transcriptional regulator
MSQPQIIEKPKFSVIGCQTSFISALSPDANNTKVLGELWHQFIHRVAEVSNRIGKESYAVIFGKLKQERTHPHELQYIAGVPVSSIANIPAGMVSYTVPSSTFAVFIHRGLIAKIGATIQEIYQIWLPESPCVVSGPAEIELYDHRFKLDREDSEMEYWIPIKPKCA